MEDYTNPWTKRILTGIKKNELAPKEKSHYIEHKRKINGVVGSNYYFK